MICLRELLECVEPWLSHSFLLPFSLFFSLPLFFLFFSISPFSLSLFFKQDRADTFLKQGYSFGWLKLAARCLAISPTLGLLCKSQVCNFGVSFRVCSNSKEHHSVQLMQSSCSRASYVPCSSSSSPKIVRTKNTRRCILCLKTCSCFIVYERYIFF